MPCDKSELALKCPKVLVRAASHPVVVRKSGCGSWSSCGSKRPPYRTYEVAEFDVLHEREKEIIGDEDTRVGLKPNSCLSSEIVSP